MKKTLIAALMLLGMFHGSELFAQDPEEGLQFPPQEAQQLPEPINPTTLSLDSGRLMIAVGSTRNYGYHIGELIPVTIVVSADKNVMVNLEALKRKTLTADASDFEFAADPIITQEEKGAKTVWRIQLLLRSWVINKPILVLNCDLHYATGILPDGKTPNWKPLSTPDYVIEVSNLASEASKNLLPGDMEFKEGPRPQLTAPLRYTAWFLLALTPSYLIIAALRRVRPRRKPTTAEAAWVVFDQILAELAHNGGKLSYEHLERISSTLRSYLRIESIPSSQCAIPLEEFFAMHDDKSTLVRTAGSALSKLDRALYSKMELSNMEELALVAELERLVPRPR